MTQYYEALLAWAGRVPTEVRGGTTDLTTGHQRCPQIPFVDRYFLQ